MSVWNINQSLIYMNCGVKVSANTSHTIPRAPRRDGSQTAAYISKQSNINHLPSIVSWQSSSCNDCRWLRTDKPDPTRLTDALAHRSGFIGGMFNTNLWVGLWGGICLLRLMVVFWKYVFYWIHIFNVLPF